MIIRAMFIGGIIGLAFGIFVCIANKTLDLKMLVDLPIVFAIFAIPIRKWILRTFWS